MARQANYDARNAFLRESMSKLVWSTFRERAINSENFCRDHYQELDFPTPTSALGYVNSVLTVKRAHCSDPESRKSRLTKQELHHFSKLLYALHVPVVSQTVAHLARLENNFSYP